MSNKILFSCFVFFFFFSSSTVRAFDIARILGKYPEYGTFNDLLNKTGLYEEINTRQTITILVVQNDSMADVAGRPLDVIKRILSTHIMLDYFDVPKIVQLSTKSTMVTNLYQSSGIADNFQGFLNITSTPDKKIGFGSAVKGSPIDVKLQKLVISQPYNISVLQVSGIIYTPGIDGTLAAPPRRLVSPPPALAKKNDPSSSPSPSSGDSDDYNEDDPVAPATSTPAESPKGSAPSESPKAADAPEADNGPADSSTKSLGIHLSLGLLSSLILTLLVSLATF